MLNDVRNHNNIIGKHAAHTLTHLQDCLGSKSPLVPVIVRTMMRKHHLHAQQFGVWHQQGRANGMDMQYICTQLLRLIDGAECMDDCLETLLLRRRNRYQFHPLPFMQVILHIVRATDQRYVIPTLHHSREQFLTMRLHATHDIRDTTSTCYNYFHKN